MKMSLVEMSLVRKPNVPPTKSFRDFEGGTFLDFVAAGGTILEPRRDIFDPRRFCGCVPLECPSYEIFEGFRRRDILSTLLKMSLLRKPVEDFVVGNWECPSCEIQMSLLRNLLSLRRNPSRILWEGHNNFDARKLKVGTDTH